MRKQLLAGVLLSLSAAVFAGLAPNKEALAKVASGEVTEARLSWWGFDENDSTAMIRDAIASKATTLVVDKMASPWVTLPVKLKSDFTLKFEGGAEFLAKKGAYKNRGDCLITIEKLENVKLVGEGKGGILRMHKADYQGPDYLHGEWRHCIVILSSNNVLVENMSAIESGGDGIYVGVSNFSTQHYSKDVVIRKCNCDRNHRQGISIIAAINLLIEDTRMTNTSGTPPQSGIDFEPNSADEPLQNCVMRNCYTENNRGCGYEFYLPQQDASKCGKDSFVIENCVGRNDQRPEFNFTTRNYHDRKEEQPWEGEALVKNCVFENSKDMNICFGVDCWQKVDVAFVNCTSRDDRKNGKLGKPIHVNYVRKSADGKNHTKIAFENMVVEDTSLDMPVEISDRIMVGSPNYSISGDIKCKANGETRRFVYSPKNMARYYPDSDYSDVKEYELDVAAFAPADAGKGVSLAGARVRHKGVFWVYLTEGKESTITLTYGQLVRNAGKTTPVDLISATGKHYPLGTIEFQKTKTFKVMAPEGTGIYKVVFENGNNWSLLENSSVPAGLWLEKGKGLNMLCMRGTYYMYVPKGIKEAVIAFFGDGSIEGAKITIKDPAGKVAFFGDNITTKLVKLDGKKPGVWSCIVQPPSRLNHEDLVIQVTGIPPFIATAPEALPVLKK